MEIPGETTMFEVINLQAKWRNSDSLVFSDVNFQLPENSITALCGINGSGKSTLLSVMAGIIPENLETEGKILLNGKEILGQNPKQTAKQISFLVQNENNVWDISVRNLVEAGRYVHQKWYEVNSESDEKAVDEAIRSMNLQKIQHKSIFNISGGELQRARIARALAQETPYIFLDEPLASLDLHYQKELISILNDLCKNKKTVFLSIHDINLAADCAQQIIMIKSNGSGILKGTPEELMTKANLSEIFDCPLEIYEHPITGKPQIW